MAVQPLQLGGGHVRHLHLELRRLLGIDLLINEANASAIWEQANAKLAKMDTWSFLEQAKVDVACTTDDPADAEDWHQRLLGYEKEFLQDLEVPFQVLDVASGDLGLSAARKYDVEAWVPTQQAYRELTSTSNCTSYQARRLDVRYRPPVEGGGTGKTVPVATLVAKYKDGWEAQWFFVPMAATLAYTADRWKELVGAGVDAVKLLIRYWASKGSTGEENEPRPPRRGVQPAQGPPGPRR